MEMIQNLWSDADATGYISRYQNPDVALRIYSSRLLGQEPSLVLHGGGNTSVKTTETDLFGTKTPVLRIKGSGWDLAAIEPIGLPAVRLEPLLRLEQLEQLTDEAMVNYLRGCLMDSSAPTPSVESSGGIGSGGPGGGRKFGATDIRETGGVCSLHHARVFTGQSSGEGIPPQSASRGTGINETWFVHVW